VRPHGFGRGRRGLSLACPITASVLVRSVGIRTEKFFYHKNKDDELKPEEEFSIVNPNLTLYNS
jgi:hypothetical protein